MQELINLGVAYTVDGYNESKKELKKFEKKYNMKSKIFYDKINRDICSIRIPTEDVTDWIFNCNVFISCGGKL